MHLSSQSSSNFVVPDGQSETHVLVVGRKSLFTELSEQEVH